MLGSSRRDVPQGASDRDAADRAPGRRTWERAARAALPALGRLGLLLTVLLGIVVPSSWASALDGGAAPSALADARAGAGGAGPSIVHQAADPEATPAPPDPAALPIDTATPTATVPPTPTPTTPPPPPSPSPAALSPTPFVGDPCWGDEQITYIPENPRTNNELIIAVTSSRPHPYGRLAGTERTTFVRERQGQLGYVWEWSVALTWPGRHSYTFYVDSTVPCKKVEILVRQQYFTPTPKPADPNNANSNESANGNER